MGRKSDQNSSRLHNLQYLRAIAAIAVVYSHATFQVGELTPFLEEIGIFGVDIFFVLSGFIMVYISKPNDQPLQFIKKRIRRIVPLYWFFTLVMAGTLVVLPHLFKDAQFNPIAFLKSLFFIPEYSISEPGEVWPIVSPGWTLNYEMYFYSIFALALFLPAKLRVLVVSIAISLICLVANLISSVNPLSLFYSNTIAFEFVFGMLLAKAYMSRIKIPEPVAWACILVGFALMFIHFPGARVLSFGIPAVIIVAGSLFVNIPLKRWAVFLGDASYAIYLVHLFALGICRIIIPKFLGVNLASAIIFAVLSVIFCTIVGCLVHVLIDNWLLRPSKVKKTLGQWSEGNPGFSTAGLRELVQKLK